MHLRNVNYCTHDPRHHSSFIPVIVSGKEYPKGTCLAPILSLLLWGIREVIVLFKKIIIKIFSFYFEWMKIFFINIDPFPKRFEVKNASEV